jgi:hypothetical protein
VSNAKHTAQAPSASTQGRYHRAALALAALAFLFAAFLAPSALANYQPVAAYPNVNASIAAVNFTGAGGVPAGTLYGFGRGEVLRYGHRAEFLESWGYNVVRTGPDNAGTDEEQTLTVNATGGEYELRVDGASGASHRVKVAATATPQQVQQALEESAPGDTGGPGAGGNIEVTGGPGDAGATHPYTIKFTNALGGSPNPRVLAQDLSLSGGSPSSSVQVATARAGAYGLETCFPANGDVCQPAAQGGSPVEGPGRLESVVGLAVDPATGDVYVRNDDYLTRKNGVVQVFGPRGEYLSAFGSHANIGEAIASSPELIHTAYGGGGGAIAVDAAGDAYLIDGSFVGTSQEGRVMVFRPHSPGDYAQYEYAPGREIPDLLYPRQLALDEAGDLYLVDDERYVEKFDPSQPSAPPLWSFDTHVENDPTIAADPTTGELFFFSSESTNGDGKGRFHLLDPAGVEIPNQTFAPAQPTGQVPQLVFDPADSFEPSRPAGTLYASAYYPSKGHGELLAFARPPAFAPRIESSAASQVGATSADLSAQIDPRGNQVHYRFQYLPESAWLANHPDTEQSLDVSAESGTYTLTPTTAQGTATTVTGSTEITAPFTTLGAFHPGDQLSGPGIPPGVTITFVGSGHLQLSAPTTASGEADLTATETTAPIPFDAPASGPESVQAALNALPGIATEQVTATGATVTEQPGSPTEHAYAIAFSGSTFAGQDIPALAADSSALSGASHTATLTIANHGGAGFSSGATEAPFGGADLPSAEEGLPASITLSGLSPDTPYRFRVTAVSHCDSADPTRECTATGPDLPFRTFPAAAGLPDHRAYELVSPAQKHGGEVFPPNPFAISCNQCLPGIEGAHFPMQSASDGDSVVYEGDPFSTGAAVGENSYLSTRTASGWQTRGLSPQLARKNIALDVANGLSAVSADLSRGLFFEASPTLSTQAPAGFPDLYSQPTADPLALTPLLDFEPPNRTAYNSGANELKISYAGASVDLSRLFFTANDALTEAAEEAPPAAAQSDLYEYASGRLRSVNLLPGEEAPTPGAAFAGPATAGAISADGHRVFWTYAGHLYVRVDGTETLEVHDPGHFLAASADGSRVLLDDGCLYSFAAEQCEADLTEDAEAHHRGGFQGILGNSTDLSTVYFVDTAPLTGAQQGPQGQSALPGRPNLYLHRAGQGTRFIATLSAADNATEVAGLIGNSTDWASLPSQRTAQASPDGRYLAFMSQASLTGYDNHLPAGQSCQFGGSGEPICFEVFLYDSQADRLACASCDPSLAPPLGHSRLPLIDPKSSRFPQPRYLSDSGRLFFDSADALSPADANGRVEDVYAYEPSAVGSCESESLNRGCLSLISSGHGSTPSQFLDANPGAVGVPAARDVFFTTRAQLLPADKDDLIDLYDAREDGGLAAETEAPLSECQGAACQHPTEPPTDPTPASSSYEGPGNVEEEPAAPCKKGFVRKHGHCLKKAHHKHHKRSHRRAGRNHGGAK